MLRVRCLPYSPSNEMFPATVMAWMEDFENSIGLINRELDEHRIVEAFKRVKPTLEAWPPPSKVISHLPRRPEARKISHVPEPTEEGKQYFAVLNRLMAGEITKEKGQQLMDAIGRKQ